MSLCTILGAGEILWNYHGRVGDFAKVSPIDGSPVHTLSGLPWVSRIHYFGSPHYVEVNHALVILLDSGSLSLSTPPTPPTPPTPSRRRAPGGGRKPGSGAIPESESCRVRIHQRDRAAVSRVPELREFLESYKAMAENSTGPRWDRLKVFFSELEILYPEFFT